MEEEPRVERRRRPRRAGANAEGTRGRRETVIRLPEVDPALRDWLAEMMPGRGLLRVLRDLPEDTVQHTRNARRESLLALRSLIDAMIEDTERPRRRTRRARQVEVE